MPYPGMEFQCQIPLSKSPPTRRVSVGELIYHIQGNFDIRKIWWISLSCQNFICQTLLLYCTLAFQFFHYRILPNSFVLEIKHCHTRHRYTVAMSSQSSGAAVCGAKELLLYTRKFSRNKGLWHAKMHFDKEWGKSWCQIPSWCMRILGEAWHW